MHDQWPPAFRQAARALLLYAARSSDNGAAEQQEQLEAGRGNLPRCVLLRMLQLAAEPLNAWW